jgi:hypothetical protein
MRCGGIVRMSLAACRLRGLRHVRSRLQPGTHALAPRLITSTMRRTLGSTPMELPMEKGWRTDEGQQIDLRPDRHATNEDLTEYSSVGLARSRHLQSLGAIRRISLMVGTCR